jgi:predicted amidohydrolase
VVFLRIGSADEHPSPADTDEYARTHACSAGISQRLPRFHLQPLAAYAAYSPVRLVRKETPPVALISVAVVQSIARPGNVSGSVEDHVRLAARAVERGARLAVFPELSLTGYDRGLTRSDALAPSDPRLRPLQSISDLHDITLIAGAPLESSRGVEIAALCFAPRRSPSTYSKRFLHEGEEVAFVPGPGGESLFVDGNTVCIAICADIAHGEHALAAASHGADIYAASCFITPDGYADDAALLAAYAAEHRMAVLMANYGAPTSAWNSAGRSSIWSSAGALLGQAAPHGEDVLVVELPPRTAE